MKAILACTPSGGIGYKGSLPWNRLEGDLPRFKELTEGQYVIMGRNTWESLPKRPLPDRVNVIVTSSPLITLGPDPRKNYQADIIWAAMNPETITVNSADRFIDHTDAWIIGGARLINSSWNLVNEIHLSRTHKEYECDTFIDLNYIEDNFHLDSVRVCKDHNYEIWKRK